MYAKPFFYELLNMISPQDYCHQKGLKDSALVTMVIEGVLDQAKKNDAKIERLSNKCLEYGLTGFGYSGKADRWDMKFFLKDAAYKMGVDFGTAYYWRFGEHLLKQLNHRINQI